MFCLRILPAMLLFNGIACLHGMTGSITVKVIDQEGIPVSGATVHLAPPPGKMPLTYVSPQCKTDAAGYCTRKDLPLNTYIVKAYKISDGYPDTTFAIYGHHTHNISVDITQENPNAEAVFTLGPRAAQIKLEMLDDDSNLEIKNATILIRNASDPNEFVAIGKSADGSILLPSGLDIHLEIRAEKHESWNSADHPDIEQGSTFHLQTGERRTITPRLKPR